MRHAQLLRSCAGQDVEAFFISGLAKPYIKRYKRRILGLPLAPLQRRSQLEPICSA